MKEVISLKEQCKALIINSSLYQKAIGQQSNLIQELKDELKNDKEKIESKKKEKIEYQSGLYTGIVGIINRGHGI